MGNTAKKAAAKKAAPPPAPPEDPLADLRDPEDVPPVPVQGDEVDVTELAVMAEHGPAQLLVTQERHDEMVSEAVAAWHQDPTSQGFLHGGGQCGCRYIARLGLSTALPIQPAEEPEEPEERDG